MDPPLPSFTGTERRRILFGNSNSKRGFDPGTRSRGGAYAVVSRHRLNSLPDGGKSSQQKMRHRKRFTGENNEYNLPPRSSARDRSFVHLSRGLRPTVYGTHHRRTRRPVDTSGNGAAEGIAAAAAKGEQSWISSADRLLPGFGMDSGMLRFSCAGISPGTLFLSVDDVGAYIRDILHPGHPPGHDCTDIKTPRQLLLTRQSGS